MGFLDKFVHAMNINDDDDDYDYDDDEYYDDENEEEEEEPVKPRKSLFGGRKEKAKEEEKEEPSRSSKSSKITPMRNSRRRTDSNGREICMFKPSTSDESADIMDALRSDRTVILNLEGINEDLAQKIIYVVSGACYMVDGNMQKISNFIFVVAPKNVALSGDARGDVVRDSMELREVAGRF